MIEEMYNNNAEVSILGSIMLNNDIMENINLNERDFYRAKHQVVFKAMKEMREDHIKIEITTLSDKLNRMGKLDDVGGYATILELNGAMATTSGYKTYEKIIKDYSLRRNFGELLKNLEFQMNDAENIKSVIDDAQKELLSLSQDKVEAGVVHTSDVATEWLVDYKEKCNTRNFGMSYGFANLDGATHGGMRKGQLIILAARPAMGKTAFALNIAEKVARKVPVLMVSMEMSTEQLMARLFKCEKNLNGYGGIFWDSMEKTREFIDTLKLYIYDKSNVTVNDIGRAARKIKYIAGELGLIVIDYLQLMKSESNNSNRVQEVSELTRSLKVLARELDVPIIVLSQLSRQVEGRQDKRPMLSDLRESGSIEQDADMVMFLYREAYYTKKEQPVDVTELIIGKQRDGQVGTLWLNYNREATLFSVGNKPNQEAK